MSVSKAWASAAERGAICVDRRASVWEIADAMDMHGVGCVVVVDDEDAPVGVVTDRDLVRRVVAADRDEEKATAAEVMSDAVVTGTPRESGSVLLERMREHRVRRIPLVDGGKLVGLVSYDDVVAELASGLANVAEAIRVELRETARTTAQRRRREAREELLEDVRTYLAELEQDVRERAENELDRWLGWLRGNRD